MAHRGGDECPVVFNITPQEWEALARRGRQNTRWPEQEAGAIVRRALRRDLRERIEQNAATEAV
jgi:hypothetical protein